MTRQVIRGAAAATRGVRAAAVPGTEDGYLDRLLKLLPAETVAAYLFVDGVVKTALKDQPDALRLWLWIVFGIIALGNVLYWRKSGVKDTLQFVLLTLAFAVWVFTIGGPFAQVAWYQPFMGSVILGLFTFLVPLIYEGLPETP